MWKHGTKAGLIPLGDEGKNVTQPRSTYRASCDPLNPLPNLHIAWRLKHLTIPTARAHQPPFQPNGKLGPQRLEVQLLAVDALAHGAGLQPIAVGAAHMHLPTEAPGHAYRLEFHENKDGTLGGVGQAFDWSPTKPFEAAGSSTALAAAFSCLA
jgi:hypothetical protein